MAEYIERERVLANAVFIHGKWDDTYISAEKIKEIPAADVAPVVYGRWIYDEKAQRPYCSVCKEYFYGAVNSPMSYCSNYGAKMDGGAGNET